MTLLDGWFFDAYPVKDGMAVWVLDDAGVAKRFFDPFAPAFHLRLDARDALRLAAIARNLPVTLSRTVKTELFSGEAWEVEEVRVRDPLGFNRCVAALQKYFPHFAFYDSNIPVAQMYLYDRGVFPLARCRFEAGPGGVLRRIEVRDRFDAPDYILPDLRIMRIVNGAAESPSKFFRTLRLEVGYDGATYALEGDDPVSVLESFNWHLHDYDPDIVLTSWGDATLLPTIVNASVRHRVPLLLNRDQTQEFFTTQERSYWTYGQIIHRDAAFMLAGRWHMDAENSFIMGESDIEGVIELARLTQLPMQKQSRAAIGTGLASMQMSYAYRNNILIPAEKKEGEDFKTADDLLLSDRGGLVFMPDLGYHEEVAELDFASMYPSLMELHNISPETINCRCCDNRKVPELGYTVCEKRRGIVPETLRPVLEKRAYYKLRKKNAPTLAEYRRYDRRQNALKWMLVTCFGYLGYKNARFGRIEAHEAVNAYSREALLTAKEMAEADGFHLVHAIIDCLWLKRPGATREDYLGLCAKIREAVGVTVSFEGMYRWLLFPSSKTDPGIPTSGKYAGWYEHGEIKTRGIEVRRKDTPWFIKTMQARLLECMSEMKDVAEIARRAPELIREAGFYLNELRGGRVDARQLVLRRRVQKEAGEYVTNNLSAMVVRELAQFGVTVKAGEVIEYVIVDQSGKRDPQKAKSLLTYQHWDGYDIEKYTEFFLKAVETLLSPFGYDRERLAALYGPGNGKKPRGGHSNAAMRSGIPIDSDKQMSLLTQTP